MGWKDLHFWLKGGIVAGVFYVLLSFVLFPFDKSGLITSFLSPGIWFYEIKRLIIGSGLPGRFFKDLFFYKVISLIGWILIGVLLGFVIGKIKKKNGEDREGNQKLIQAKRMVEDARKKGYSDEVLKKMFKENGWNDEYLGRIFAKG